MSSFMRTLSRVLRIGNARYIAGKDLQNNIYYELPSHAGSRGEQRAHGSRFSSKDECDVNAGLSS